MKKELWKGFFRYPVGSDVPDGLLCEDQSNLAYTAYALFLPVVDIQCLEE